MHVKLLAQDHSSNNTTPALAAKRVCSSSESFYLGC